MCKKLIIPITINQIIWVPLLLLSSVCAKRFFTEKLLRENVCEFKKKIPFLLHFQCKYWIVILRVLGTAIVFTEIFLLFVYWFLQFSPLFLLNKDLWNPSNNHSTLDDVLLIDFPGEFFNEALSLKNLLFQNLARVPNHYLEWATGSSLTLISGALLCEENSKLDLQPNRLDFGLEKKIPLELSK